MTARHRSPTNRPSTHKSPAPGCSSTRAVTASSTRTRLPTARSPIFWPGLKLSLMPARTGQQYIDSLKRMSPCIYLNGRLVSDVTEEPVFQGAIKSIAELYDLQHDPRYSDFMLYESPTTGEPVHVSFQVPKTKQELVNKRK